VSTVLRSPVPRAPAARSPSFDAPVPPDGYRWWYVDALSDDGAFGLTVIAFVGSVFSPYYAWARRHGPADPADHCALNVGLYGPRAARWAMTERPRERVERSRDAFVAGPSAVTWDGSALTVRIDEWTVPVPRRVRGWIRLWPHATLHDTAYALDAHARHRWTPLAPHARVKVELEQPDLRWAGTGYFDSNAGDEPLERGFARWTWSRADLGAGEAAVLYDMDRRDGSRESLALRFDASGEVAPFDPPPPAPLATAAIWRIPRHTRSEPGAAPRVLSTFLDTPFYARSLIESRLCGATVRSVHESLDLDRFRSPVVQLLLPVRMPRARRGR
jgi:carotenoid 1,2-hydratase